MKLTCAQMDVLISFYIDGDLSSTLKSQVEEHIKLCPTCRAKFDIIKSMLLEMKNNLGGEMNFAQKTAEDKVSSQQYRIFKNNLSAYVDNELSEDESVKFKKFAIHNKNARKDLENIYNIRKLMSESFKKSKSESKRDFSKHVLRQLELEDEASLGVHPAIKLLVFFMLSVFVFTTLVLLAISG
jgi:anti-sigma factor RsiW